MLQVIAHIAGALADVTASFCLVFTSGGVGYRIFLPSHTLDGLPPAGDHVSFYTSMIVRENAQELYGFATFEERQTFEILRSINKIGPKVALAVLSAYRPAELCEIVYSENLHALKKVAGLGPKTAQHLLLELRDKLKAFAVDSEKSVPVPRMPSVHRDVLAALANLGYTDAECAPVVAHIFRDEPDLDVGGGIRMALKELARGKK